MPRFPEHWMQELLSRTEIADLIGEYVRLKPSGGRLWGLCPFHGEKTASFSVSRDKQLYYCFGCHAGGGALQFVMAVEKMTFSEAVQHLAQRVNLSLPEQIDDANLQQEASRRRRILAANREAARFYYAQLRGTADASVIAYLEGRGVSAATATAFGIGYAQAGWDALCVALLAKGFSEDELLAAGLARRKERRLYDNFRNRLMFPIISPGRQRNVIGFGGRAIGDAEPKYLNTAENPVFNKRRHLYGLNQLPNATPDSITLVEGYMDVVSLHQHGIHTAVATLGTALTEPQARLLKRYTPRVYLAYDGDEAGQNAASRCLDVLRREGIDARVVRLPDGLDPDDFIRQRGKSDFDGLCAQADAYGDFQIRRLAATFDPHTDDGRAAFAREGAALIARMSPIEQERYFPKLSQATGYSVAALRGEADLWAGKNRENTSFGGSGKNRLTNNRNTSGKQTLPISGDRMDAERILIRIASGSAALRDPIVKAVSRFRVEAHIGFLEAMRGAESFDPAVHMSEMTEADAALIAAALAENVVGDETEIASSLLRALERFDRNERRAALQREADDPATTNERRAACIVEIRAITERLVEMKDEI